MTSLTRPLPPEAVPIVRIIRYGVPRPVELPLPRLLNGKLLRWRRRREGLCCPMGLLSCARLPTPVDPEFCGIYGFGRATMSFAAWWDSCRDPAAAVAAVWDEPLE